MKRNCFVLLACLMLTGCSVSTPYGTAKLTFDSSEVSDKVVYTDYNGKSVVLNTSSAKSYVDQLLDSVDLPQGTSTDDLKSYVYSSLDSLGIDLDNLDFSDKEKVSEAEDSIKNSLEEQGVDTSDLDIDLESIKEAE